MPDRPVGPERPKRWQVVDESATSDGGDIARQFETDRRLAERVGRGEAPPTLRLWRHRGAFVLGPRDARLPYADAARAWLQQTGRSTAVRPSGGWAVPLDAGVLNLSMLLPVDREGAGWAYRIERGFQAMHALVRRAVEPLGFPVEQGEVPGGYCPGESDIGLHGRKVGGVAQRLAGSAVAVQAFLVVEGRGSDLARLAAEFYDRATGGNPTNVGAPVVREGAMASLSELLDLREPTGFSSSVSVADVAAGVRRAVANFGS